MPADESFRCPACNAKLKFGKRPKSRVTCPRCGHEFDYNADAATQPTDSPGAEALPPTDGEEKLGGTAAFALALQEATKDPPPADADENLEPFDAESTDDDRELPRLQPLAPRRRVKKKPAAGAEGKADAFTPSRKLAPRKYVSASDNPLAFAMVGAGALLVLGVIALMGILLFRNSRRPTKFEPPEKYVAMRLGFIPLSGMMPEGWESAGDGGGVNGPPVFAKVSDGGSISIEIRESLVLKLVRVAVGRRGAALSIDQVHEYYGEVAKKIFSNYKEDSERPIQTEGFGEAYVSDFSGSEGMFGFGGNVKGCRASLQHAGRQYNVICKCPPAQFEDVKPVFEKIIASLGTGETR